MRSALFTPLLVVAALVCVAAPTAAQVFVEPFAMERTAEPGESVELAILVSNPTDREYFVASGAAGDLAAHVTLDPGRASLLPRSELQVTARFVLAADAPAGRFETDLVMELVDTQSAATFEKRVPVVVVVAPARAYLGLVPHAFPPPLDDGWGLFVVEAASWLALAGLAAAAGSAVAKWASTGARHETRTAVAKAVRGPLALAILAVGLRFSWRLVPGNPVTRVVGPLLALLAVVAVAVLVYQAITAALLYYSDVRSRGRHADVDAVLVPVLKKVAAVGVVAFGIAYGLQALGIDVSFLLAGGVVIGLVLSLAAQDTLSNLFSGFFILLDRPFREGDEIQLETGEVCRVDHVGVRSTRLFHFRHEQVMVVPNNELATKRVTNLSYPDATYRLHVAVGVSYATDLVEAVRVVTEVAKAHPDVISGGGRDPVVWLKAFGDSSIEMELRVYIPSSRHRNPVRTALIMAIKSAFDEKGIAIPFPQREVWLRDADGSRARAGSGDE